MMALRRLKLWSLVASLLLLCQKAEGLASSRPIQTLVEPQEGERLFYRSENQHIQPDHNLSSDSATVSRRNLIRQAGVASASIFLSSLSFLGPLPAKAAETLDSYLVSGNCVFCLWTVEQYINRNEH